MITYRFVEALYVQLRYLYLNGSIKLVVNVCAKTSFGEGGFCFLGGDINQFKKK